MKIFAYIEATLVASQQAEPFKDEKGEDVVYFENQLLTEDGVMQLNSKASFNDAEKLGKKGVAKIAVRQIYNDSGNVKGHKLTLAGFAVGEEIDELAKA